MLSAALLVVTKGVNTLLPGFPVSVNLGVKSRLASSLLSRINNQGLTCGFFSHSKTRSGKVLVFASSQPGISASFAIFLYDSMKLSSLLASTQSTQM